MDEKDPTAVEIIKDLKATSKTFYLGKYSIINTYLNNDQ
jgi:hypothetical protein